MLDNRKLELLKKIRALADRGDRGEREAAQKHLERLMEKYNIQEADLSDNVISIHWFKFTNAYERKLLYQIANKIAPSSSAYTHVAGKGKRTELGVKCTQAVALQISIEFDFYKRLWGEELHLFYLAFLHKHEIFPDVPPSDSDRTPSMSKEEIYRMSRMMDGIKDAVIHQMIEEAT